MTDKIVLTSEELIDSFELGFSVASSMAELLQNGISINTLIHVLAVNIGGMVCEKYKIETTNTPQITDEIIATTIRLVKQNQESKLPKPSNN